MVKVKTMVVGAGNLTLEVNGVVVARADEALSNNKRLSSLLADFLKDFSIGIISWERTSHYPSGSGTDKFRYTPLQIVLGSNLLQSNFIQAVNDGLVVLGLASKFWKEQ